LIRNLFDTHFDTYLSSCVSNIDFFLPKSEILPHINKQKEPKPYYRKSTAVKELERMANEAAMFKHPTCPHLAPRKFRDDNANGLTQCIVQYIVLSGGFATRINNQGTWSKKLNRFIPGTSRKGLSDVMATYKGLSLHIEVKIGKDRQSGAQKKVESEVTRSGGLYYLAKNFTDFKEWFDSISL
jgi:hypothetical protein